MAKQKHKPRRKQQGIMGRSDLPLALRKKIEQQERIRVNRENAARVTLYAYSIAMNEIKGVGYKGIIRFEERYRELEDEFYEDVEVGLEHAKQRLASHGILISGELLTAPPDGRTVRQQEVADNIVQTSQVSQIVAAVAMNDTFGYGREVQDRIRIRVEELTARYAKEGIGPLLDGMEKIGFYIHGEKAIHFSDEEGNIVTVKKALGKYAANNRQVAGK